MGITNQKHKLAPHENENTRRTIVLKFHYMEAASFFGGQREGGCEEGGRYTIG